MKVLDNILLLLFISQQCAAFTLPRADNNRVFGKPRSTTVLNVSPVEEKVSGKTTNTGKELQTANSVDEVDDTCEVKELSESEKLLQKIKDAGTAGFISYAAWEWAFWMLSIPVCSVAYYQLNGHWPDFSNQEDMAKLGAEAFAFVNFARFAVPLRIGLALSTTPWVEENVVQRFFKKEDEECEPSS